MKYVYSARTSLARASGSPLAPGTATRNFMQAPRSSSGSSTTSSSGMPRDPSLAMGMISTLRVPTAWPSLLRILASTLFSTCRRTPSNSTCATPISRSTSMGSQSGSSSFGRCWIASKPSSSARWSSSRRMKTLFSNVSGFHSNKRTPFNSTAAVTFTAPLLPSAVSSQCIFVSSRCDLPSSWMIRFASLTKGMTVISCSSSLCIASSCCR
mmetsp:Transcript_8252/g.19372  ORF Transcript_8252/g.19372 Transcript_8252/m.19372 type:complete len:211 (-) Transcript_8252:2239-2871(-)